ncbi:MAG: GNAT family N-acetyltransferase [Raineya sp.]|jgi:GNAT superfamily N-acetyltransferase|nr:GNAT family N-acetyltransferase [Raineya sp.]
MDLKIKEGKPQDIPALLGLIKELALYEKAPEQVINTEEKMLEDGFGKQPVFKFWLAWDGDIAVGMAVVYFRYSTWKGKCLYLEDLYIKEEYRKHKLGHYFFDVLKRYGKEENCQRISWQVLDWNEPAINFYKKIGASLDPEWVNGFLEL